MSTSSILGRGRLVALLAPALALGCGDDSMRDDGDGDGDPTTFRLRIENVGEPYRAVHSGMFDTAVDATMPGPIGPGGAFEIDVTAGRGQRLSFATMFAQSNDFFFAPDGEGIALYDDAGAPISGDVTDQVMLWDAGTEADQEPGLGSDQAPRQAAPDSGERDPDPRVRLAADSFGNLPAVAEVIRVTVTPGDDQRFTVRIENVSTEQTLETSDGATHPVPLSPGSWAVHGDPDPLFTVGANDRGEGLEGIAEDGAAAALTASLAADTGVTVPLSPGAWVVHTDDAPLFAAGAADRGDGLERIAEDGDPTQLAGSLERAGTFADAPIPPGEAIEVTFTASPGDRLSFATMYAQSNDLFFAPAPGGLVLFEGDDPASGDVTGEIALWDAGTEINQEPGVGNDQAPRQLAPDTGPGEDLPVVTIGDRGDGFDYAAVGDLIRVTLDRPEP